MIVHGTILVVDDEEAIRVALADALESYNFVVVQAASADEAVRLSKNRIFDIALIDLRMPGELDGMELMAVLRAQNPPTDVIILTAYGTLDTSLEAMRSGVFDYLLKPVDTGKVIETVERCLEQRRDQEQRHRVIDQIETLLVQLKSAEAGPDGDQEKPSGGGQKPNPLGRFSETAGGARREVRQPHPHRVRFAGISGNACQSRDQRPRAGGRRARLRRRGRRLAQLCA
jgi:YesN/AraC family two-component response regulator